MTRSTTSISKSSAVESSTDGAPNEGYFRRGLHLLQEVKPGHTPATIFSFGAWTTPLNGASSATWT